MIALRSTIIRFYNNSINCSLTAVIGSVRECSGAPEFLEECSKPPGLCQTLNRLALEQEVSTCSTYTPQG